MWLSQALLHGVVLRGVGEAVVADLAERGLEASAALEPSWSLLAATFMLGFVAVWIYIAIRPRSGQGTRTALLAGVAVWLTSHLYTAVYMFAGVGVWPESLVWMPPLWTRVEVPVATVIGAWLYRD